MSEHTPEPWRVDNTYVTGRVIHDELEEPGKACGCEVIIHDPPCADILPCGQDDELANSALIAAAPDLLAACELTLSTIEAMRKLGEPTDSLQTVEWKARAAIAKAG